MWLSHSMLLVNHLLIALCYETKTFIGLSYSLKTHLISNNCRHQQRLRNLLCAHTFFSFHLELIVKEIVLGAHSPTEALTWNSLSQEQLTSTSVPFGFSVCQYWLCKPSVVWAILDCSWNLPDIISRVCTACDLPKDIQLCFPQCTAIASVSLPRGMWPHERGK